MQQIEDRITLRTDLSNTSTKSFKNVALAMFRYQYDYNKTYRSFCDLLGTKPASVLELTQIPFLPIAFFKTKTIVSSSTASDFYFESSGTTGTVNSKHFVADLPLYEKSFITAFQSAYGDVKSWCFVGLLPGYLERERSSLVYMVNKLIELSGNENSGFYLDNYEALAEILKHNEARQQKTLLIGVTFALVNFSQQYATPLRYTTVMETGGMKGRQKEITRGEVHNIIGKSFGLTHVHSEYGMTELLSQAYAKENGKFLAAQTMQVLLRSEDDPLELIEAEQITKARAGALNIIDLANIDSCAFIATDDVGILYPDGMFEVVGRLDNSDIRGCSLMLLT